MKKKNRKFSQINSIWFILIHNFGLIKPTKQKYFLNFPHLLSQETEKVAFVFFKPFMVNQIGLYNPETNFLNSYFFSKPLYHRRFFLWFEVNHNGLKKPKQKTFCCFKFTQENLFMVYKIQNGL